jgi:hypothetical protein
MMHLLLQQQPYMDVWQAIFAADTTGQEAVKQMLLDHPSDKGLLLARAATHGRTSIVQAVLAHDVALLQHKQVQLAAPHLLKIAMCEGQVQWVRMLMPHVNRSHEGKKGDSPVATGTIDIVQSLPTALDSNAQLDGLLVRAVQADLVSVAQLLLSLGADVNEGQPLAKAVKDGSLELMQLLLSHGADANAGQPLAIACSLQLWYGHAVAEKLLAHGADINLGEPLAKAAAAGKDEIVRVLLAHGADTSLGHPLVKAAEQGHPIVVQLLLQHMAAAHGREAVSVAASAALTPVAAAGHQWVVDLLLKYGADVRDSSA